MIRRIILSLSIFFISSIIAISAFPCDHRFDESTRRVGFTTVTWRSDFHIHDYLVGDPITFKVIWKVRRGAAIFRDFSLIGFTPKSKRDPVEGELIGVRLIHDSEEGQGEVEVDFKFTGLHRAGWNHEIGNAHFRLLLNIDRDKDGRFDRVAGYEVNVHVETRKGKDNLPPVVDAGPNQTVTLPNSVILNGTVSDDGLPVWGTLSMVWTKVSGPGDVSFNHSNTAVTTATFSQAGTYILRLTANDSQLFNSDDVTITVKPANKPPVADAGEDQTVILPSGQKTVEVTLDGSGSNDPDGSIMGYLWTGLPDPEDMIKPKVLLPAGVHTFNLTVSDDKGAYSESMEVTIRVLGPPMFILPPPVTNDPVLSLKGLSLPGAEIIVRNGDNEKREVSEHGFFEISLALTEGANQFQIFSEFNGFQSEAVTISVTYTSETSLYLESISSPSGMAGSILTLRGSGFTPDKKIMGVHFKGTAIEGGTAFEGEGLVLDATENTLTVVVPFIFLKSDEDISIYVHDSSRISNSITFHVIPSVDRTPDIAGNEMTYQFNLLATQVERAMAKLEQLTRPRVPAETWNLIEENIDRLRQFVNRFKDQMVSIPSDEVKSSIDAAFSSDLFLVINQKLEQINEILSHSTDGEAICNVNEVIEILNSLIGPLADIEDTLDWVIPALYVTAGANGVACFFGCVPCCGLAVFMAVDVIPVMETINGIIEAILSVLGSIEDIFHAVVPSTPSDWKVISSGPFPGIDSHFLYTSTENTLSLYANFTNHGFRELVGRNIRVNIPDAFGAFSVIEAITGIDLEREVENALGRSLFNFILDLAGIDDISVSITDVLVPSTLERRDKNNFLISIEDEGTSAEVHRVLAGSSIGSVDLDIRGSCGSYDYPKRTNCKQSMNDVCLEWEQVYPDDYTVEIIETPSVTSFDWHDSDQYWVLDDWTVIGKGFSNNVNHFTAYLNGEPIWLCGLTRDEFTLCGIRKPGWLSVAVKDMNGQRRESTPIFVMPPPDHQAYTGFYSNSGFVGDTVLAPGNIFTPYPEDVTIDFIDRNGMGLATIHPDRTWVHTYTEFDVVGFRIPEALYGQEGEELRVRIKVGPPGTPCNSYNCTESSFNLREEESIALNDQDMTAHGRSYSYLRSAVIGDLDGDGENDLIIGVPEERNFGNAIGAVYIAFGPVRCQTLIRGDRSTEIVDLLDSSCWDVKIIGDPRDVHEGGNSRRIGNSLAVGDVDGDSIADLLIGTTDQNDLDEHTPNILIQPTSPGHIPGKAYLFYGRARQEWMKGQSNAIYHTEISGRESWGYDVKFFGDNDRELGYQVAIGSLKNDLWADMVISAPTDSVLPDTPNQLLARTYVIFGRAVRLMGDIELGNPLAGLRDSMTIEEQNFFQIEIRNFENMEYTQYKGNGLGKSIAIGDVNGDRVDDLLLSAPQHSRVPGGSQLYMRQGAAYLFYGGFSFYSHTSRAVGPTGDQDALIEGPPVFQVDEKSGFARSLAILDLNHDGKGELFFGAPAAKLNYRILPHCLSTIIEPMPIEETEIGRVYMVNGANLNLNGWRYIEGLNDLTIHGSPTLSQFGAALGSADLSGDGIKDLIVGAPGRWGTSAVGRVWIMYGKEAPEWVSTNGSDVLNLFERQWYYDTIEFYEPYEENLFGCGRPLGEIVSDFSINSDSPATYYSNFGSFIATGDLGPYSGEDVLIINPFASGPANPNYPSEPLRDHSGMLYLFYQTRFISGDVISDMQPIDLGDSNPTQIIGGLIENGDPEDGYQWNCDGNLISLDLDEVTSSGELINPNPSLKVFLYQMNTGMEILQGTGGFLNAREPKDGICGLIIQSLSASPIQYRGVLLLQPRLSVSPISIDVGETGTVGSFSISNTGSGTLSWSITADLPMWLTIVSPMNGETAAGETSTVILNVNRNMMVVGNYSHHITISSNGGNGSVKVTMAVPEPSVPMLSVSPSSLDFGIGMSERWLTINNIGGGTLSWNITADLPGWLSTSLMSGETLSGGASTVILNVNRDGLSPGQYSHTLSITSNGGTAYITVSMRVELPISFTIPYYSCSEVYGEKSYVDLDGYAENGQYSMNNAEGTITTSLAGGYRGWCYSGEVGCSCDFPVPLNFPGDHPLYMSGSSCIPNYTGWMGTWASIVADPEAGAMTSLVGGLSQNGPVKTCYYSMGRLYCYQTPPPDWGSGYGYGYLRQVFSVQSNDGTLPIGTPVWVQANIQMEGVFEGNGLGSMQAVVILNKIENASWLSWSWTNGCLKWNVLQEAILPFFPNMLGYKTIGIDSSSAVDQDNDGLKEFNFSENITANVSVGDVIVVETFLKSDISLENPAELGSSEGWNGEAPEALMLNPGNVTDEGLKASIQQYGNNLKTTLITNTPGAILVPYTHSP